MVLLKSKKLIVQLIQCVIFCLALLKWLTPDSGTS